jgi:predicted dienelactone hydrolase
MPPTGRYRPTRRHYLLRRITAATGVVLFVAVAVTIGVVVDHHDGPAPTRSSTTSSAPRSTSTAPTTSTPPTTEAPAGPPFTVGMTSFQLAIDGQVLPTDVRYPVDSAGGPDTADGPYPLVVFSQGFDIAPEAYAAILQAWATDGFVVADPAYPHTSPGAPDGLYEGDIINHPAELRGVIADLVTDGSTAGNPLDGIVDASEIAIAGHSDGGDVTLAVADNSAWQDPVVKAAIIFSGAELTSFGGTYFAPGSPDVPLLVTQGTADTINVPPCSVQIYDQAPQPKYYLSLLGAEHEPPYLDPGQDRQIVIAVSTAFLNDTLKGEHSEVATMMASGSVPGVSTITSAATVPPPTAGGCPGAPEDGAP